MKEFTEHCYSSEDDQFIACACNVSADKDGYFITIKTDPYEGSAILTLPVARMVLLALSRAIEHSEQVRKDHP